MQGEWEKIQGLDPPWMLLHKGWGKLEAFCGGGGDGGRWGWGWVEADVIRLVFQKGHTKVFLTRGQDSNQRNSVGEGCWELSGESSGTGMFLMGQWWCHQLRLEVHGENWFVGREVGGGEEEGSGVVKWWILVWEHPDFWRWLVSIWIYRSEIQHQYMDWWYRLQVIIIIMKGHFILQGEV